MPAEAAARHHPMMAPLPDVLHCTADEIRDFCEEFPYKKARVEELIRAKKIVVTDEQKETSYVRSKNS